MNLFNNIISYIYEVSTITFTYILRSDLIISCDNITIIFSFFNSLEKKKENDLFTCFPRHKYQGIVVTLIDIVNDQNFLGP